jgi:CRISPR/Cas system-associated protein Csm6
MTTINLTLNVQVAGGPKDVLSLPKPIAVEAYDKIEVTIKPGTQQTVAVQPGDAPQVNFLLIKSSLFGPEITYIVNDGTNDFPAAPDKIILDQPFHLYLGMGAVSVFGIAPKFLKFENAPSADKDAAIEILVGRDATP